MTTRRLAGAEAAFRRAGELYASAGQEANHARMLSVLGSVLRDLESAKPRPLPPPSPHPPNTREYFWERIIGGYLTEDDATAMWQFITEAARPGRSDAEKEFDEIASIADFNEVVLEINERADANERVVLAKLVEGQTSDAARRCDVIITQAGDAQNDKLWYKGALLATVAPEIARDALQQLVQQMPNDHYARCALGRVLERLGDDAGAEATYRAVLTSADANHQDQARALDHLGYLARKRDNLDDAGPYFERALQLYREVGDANGIYATVKDLGRLAWQRGELVLAESFFRQALENAGERTDAEDVLNTLNDIAHVAEARGDFAAAEQAVKSAIGLHEHRDDKAAVASGYEMLGDLALKRKDLQAAYSQYDHAREISQKSGDDAGTARAFGFLGLVRLREKDYDHAEWYFNTAATLLEKVGDHHRNAVMLENLGWTFMLRGDAEQARGPFDRALAGYARLGMKEEEATLRESLAKAMN